MTLQVFDEFRRLDPEPAHAEEDSFAFLNRAATPYWARVREFIEEAFAEYPAAHAADLRARFRDRRWSAHAGAWWELYLFRLFRMLDFEVEVHPRLQGVSSRPDFRVTASAGSFLVEARHVAAGIRSCRRRVGRDDWITGPLEELTHPRFVVVVRILARDPQKPRRKAVTAGVLDWLDSLDPDEPDASIYRPFRSRAGGWSFELRAVPMQSKRGDGRRRRLVGVYPGHGGIDNTASALRAALKEKAAKYGRPECPLVLAPLLTTGHLDLENVIGALFGSEAMTFSADATESARVIRRADGFWTHPDGYRGTRVSAVLIGDALMPWTAARELPRLWIHPAGARSLPIELPLPTARIDGDGNLRLRDATKSAAEVLALDRAWPGPGKPFELAA